MALRITLSSPLAILARHLLYLKMHEEAVNSHLLVPRPPIALFPTYGLRTALGRNGSLRSHVGLLVPMEPNVGVRSRIQLHTLGLGVLLVSHKTFCKTFYLME